MCNKPEVDEDGYPTEHTLQCIRDWDIQDLIEVLRYMRDAWHWQHMVDVDGYKWTFLTGGWSGNEELIRAFKDNHALYDMSWMSSNRGGKHVFVVYMI